MFEYDKGILANYKECVRDWVQQTKSDENVEMFEVCKEELLHLNNYVRRSVKNYYEHTTPVDGIGHLQGAPNVIYFQDM